MAALLTVCQTNQSRWDRIALSHLLRGCWAALKHLQGYFKWSLVKCSLYIKLMGATSLHFQQTFSLFDLLASNNLNRDAVKQQTRSANWLTIYTAVYNETCWSITAVCRILPQSLVTSLFINCPVITLITSYFVPLFHPVSWLEMSISSQSKFENHWKQFS